MAGNEFFGGMFSKAGWSIKNKKRTDDQELVKNEFIEIDGNDGSELIDSLYVIQTREVLDASFKNQADLINEYRAMSTHPEVEGAVDDIVNAVVTATEDDDPVQLEMKDIELSDATKDVINEEFNYILRLLNFDTEAYERVKQWYVDGRLVVHTIIDSDKPKEGIQDLVFLDPRSIRKVKNLSLIHI